MHADASVYLFLHIDNSSNNNKNTGKSDTKVWLFGFGSKQYQLDTRFVYNFLVH